MGREYDMRSVEEKWAQYSGRISCGERPLGRLRYRWENIIKIDH